MNDPLARRAGNAVTWKAVQLGAGKGIFLLRTLVLTRLLLPDDFGLLAIATVAIGVLMSVTEVGMTGALVHQRDLEEAHYDSAWTVNIIRALCVSSVVFVAAPVIALLFAEPRAVDILRILALKPLLDAAASTKVAGLIRNLEYRRTTFVTLPATAIETLISIALAATFGVWALVAGALAGALAGTVASYVVAPYRPRIVLTGHIIRPMIRYGRWIFLTGLVSVSASSLTQLVISRQLGAVELGLYFLAVKLAFLPHEIASQVVGEVAFPLYARIQHDANRVAKGFRSIFVGLTMLLLPAYVLLISLAPRLVEDVLGPRWHGTEPLIQLLGAAGIAGLFSDATGPLFRGLGYPKLNLATEIVQSGLVIVLLWEMTQRFGARGAAVTWLIAMALTQGVTFILARRLIQRPLEGSILPIAFVLLASLAGAATAIGLGRVAPGIGGFMLVASLAVCVTAGVLWLCDRQFRIGLGIHLVQAFPQMAPFIRAVPMPR